MRTIVAFAVAPLPAILLFVFALIRLAETPGDALERVLPFFVALAVAWVGWRRGRLLIETKQGVG